MTEQKPERRAELLVVAQFAALPDPRMSWNVMASSATPAAATQSSSMRGSARRIRCLTFV